MINCLCVLENDGFGLIVEVEACLMARYLKSEVEQDLGSLDVARSFYWKFDFKFKLKKFPIQR